jgi:hypothetical protein
MGTGTTRFFLIDAPVLGVHRVHKWTFYFQTAPNYYPKGSTTFRQQEQRGGTEADESYCIGTDKDFPDLVIEAVVSHGGLNRLEVYHRLKVPEVWFWQHERFTLYHLREETPQVYGQTYGYEEIVQSELLPELGTSLLAEYLRHPTPLAATKAFRQHLQAQRERH